MPASCPVSQKLTSIKGLSEAKVEKMVVAASKAVTTGNWMTGTMVQQLVSVTADSAAAAAAMIRRQIQAHKVLLCGACNCRPAAAAAVVLAC